MRQALLHDALCEAPSLHAYAMGLASPLTVSELRPMPHPGSPQPTQGQHRDIHCTSTQGA